MTLRVSIGVIPSGKVQLYCNAATSEVTGEYPTLHDAIASIGRFTVHSLASPSGLPFVPGACLVCGGVLLATVLRDGGWIGWRFEQAGIERLLTEFTVINSSPGH